MDLETPKAGRRGHESTYLGSHFVSLFRNVCGSQYFALVGCKVLVSGKSVSVAQIPGTPVYLM